jgi:hypothetical protein
VAAKIQCFARECFANVQKKTPDITFWLEFATNTIRWTSLSVVEKGEYEERDFYA